MIPINVPQIDEEEIEMVVEVLKSRVLTDRLGKGPMVKRLEEEFERYVGTNNAIAVNSGTAALQMALLAAGVSSGDEVILPSFTFVATAEAAVLTGARPVFVDINPLTYNIDPQKIEEVITEKTKAVLPVDLYGLPAETKIIRETAQKHDLVVVEDSAQAHGALYKERPPGYFADIACWSFYASKNMTTGEGGMVTTNNGEYAEKLRCIRSHGMKEEDKAFSIGHNYRMSEIAAAIGLAQLRKLTRFLEKRRRNADTLTERLRGAKRLQLPREPQDCKHGWHLYTVSLLDADASERNKIVAELRKWAIGATVYYHTPVHLMPYYQQFGESRLPKTERASQQVFSLPIHPGVTLDEINYIGDRVRLQIKI